MPRPKQKRFCKICKRKLTDLNQDKVCFHHDDHIKPTRLREPRNGRERNGLPTGRKKGADMYQWPSVDEEVPCNAYGYNRS